MYTLKQIKTMDTEVANEATLAESAEVQSKNGLLYELPQSLSSSVSKTYVRQYAQRQSYSNNQTIVFDMNVGSAFLDPENCFLTFDVNVGATATDATNYVSFKSGLGAISLINEVHIHAKSGVELERTQECNQYWACRSRLRDDANLWNWARQWGAAPPDTVMTTWANVPLLGRIGGTVVRVSIPMREISGLFCPTVKGMKMPNGLISGARIEITLEDFGRAFTTGVGAIGTSYTISDPQIVCLQHSLTDNSQRVLNEESSENGLEYTYTRVFTSKEQITATTQNIQVKKAVSQATRCLMASVLSANVSAVAQKSFSSNDKFTSVQFRIGSSFYPQQKLTSDVEIYAHSMNTYNKQPSSSWWSTNYTVDEYVVAAATSRNMILGCNFESDQRLNLSGVPINNSATLAIDTITNIGTSHTYYVFLEYISVSSSYLTNVEVKI